MQIKTSSRFLRKARKLGEPQATMLRAVLRRLALNPRDPMLGTHRLKGELEGYWACSVDDDLRLLFRWQKDELFIVNIGNHDQVY